ncbi:FkbM family methyltransferase [Azovibrio restrictus]|uniref:FkbM family methyltransferase n=1 Tax=Azovibrio restrictus TaxID=146938 RepID=UPI0026F19165|nr:FkbM family methyltransferase [Azovibrio restrictus]
MVKAAFVTLHIGWPWKRQLPKRQQAFDGVEFFVPVEEADIVFVYDALPDDKLVVKRFVPVVFVASEPKNVKRYNAAFLAQFDAVITSDRDTPHPRRIFLQAGLPWHAGSMAAGGKLLDTPMTFEEFEAHEPKKTKLVSVVSSDKPFTPEHRARLAFVEKLKAALGDQVDVFGRGINDFADKRDVLDAYRYHIAIENCAIKDYWTEKLADPFLTLTFPIYHGCPNIFDYFPAGSLQPINIYEPDEAIEIIREVISSDLAEQRRECLREARRRVMHEHNVFGMLAGVARELLAGDGTSSRQHVRTLYPESHFQPFASRLKLSLRSRIGRVPVLRKAFRLLKQKGHSAELKMQHYWKYLTDEFYRSHQRWLRDNPQDDVRFQYVLPSGANILDVGGYAGDFAARLIELCDANVTVFEPVSKFAAQIRERFAGDPRVRVHEAGLSDKDEVAEFDLDADASGAFGSSGGQRVQVVLWDAERFLSQCGTKEWHLAKLNIEGGEYALLNQLIETGRIKSIKYIQVQFHLNVPNARQLYKDLAKRLRRTHRLQWRYPFVWESWVRRDDAGSAT